MSDYSELRQPISDRLPIVTYANRFAPEVETVWMSPQVQRLTGYRLDDWVGRPGFFDSVLHPDDRAQVLDEMRASRRERRPFSRDYRLLRRDGEVLWIHDESVPILDENGAPELIQGYFVDITERKSLERQLLQAQRHEAMGRLAGGVAHDFNNFLTAIGGMATLAAGVLPAGSPARRYLTELLETVESATRLTRRLLAFSRSVEPAPCLVDLTAIVDGMRGMLRHVAGEGVRLAFDLEATPSVHADLGQLEQLLINLVANARDAEAGSIAIRTHTDGGAAVLSVRDDGHGMDEATRQKAFEPFFTTKDHEHGTGLGLSIVQGIVTGAGGTVAAESAPGAGTTLEIRLPAASLG